jgi:hypothetical protein
VAGGCECGNELSGSLNAGISRLAQDLLAFQEELCSMELLLLVVVVVVVLLSVNSTFLGTTYRLTPGYHKGTIK